MLPSTRLQNVKQPSDWTATEAVLSLVPTSSIIDGEYQSVGKRAAKNRVCSWPQSISPKMTNYKWKKNNFLFQQPGWHHFNKIIKDIFTNKETQDILRLLTWYTKKDSTPLLQCCCENTQQAKSSDGKMLSKSKLKVTLQNSCPEFLKNGNVLKVKERLRSSSRLGVIDYIWQLNEMCDPKLDLLQKQLAINYIIETTDEMRMWNTD